MSLTAQIPGFEANASGSVASSRALDSVLSVVAVPVLLGLVLIVSPGATEV